MDKPERTIGKVMQKSSERKWVGDWGLRVHVLLCCPIGAAGFRGGGGGAAYIPRTNCRVKCHIECGMREDCKPGRRGLGERFGVYR